MKEEKDNNESIGHEVRDEVNNSALADIPASDGEKNPWPNTYRPLWMDLLIIIGTYIGSTIFFGLILGLFAAFIKGDFILTTVISQIMVYAITIPIAIWLFRKRKMEKPILSFSFRMADPLMILWGFLLIFILSVVLEPLLNIFPSSYMDEINAFVTDGGGLGMLMVVVIAPVLEEILFRGLIQEGASREYGPIKAILIASAIFGIVHIVPQQVINAFFCGIILGYVFYRTKSLVPVIAIHLLNNAISYIAVKMSPEGTGETLRQLIENDTWYWIIYGICTAIFLFVMFKLWQQLNTAEQKTKPKLK